MCVLRVLLEFAGCGQRIASLDYDFTASDYHKLQTLVAAQLNVVRHVQVRLFYGHAGPELTVNPACFGRQRVRDYQAAEKAYQQLLKTVKADDQQTNSQNKYDVVIAVAMYTDVDLASAHMYSTHVDDILTYLTSLQSDVYTFPFFGLQLHRSEMLASANFMHSVAVAKSASAFQRYEHLISQSLRDNKDFIAETQLVHLASTSLLDCQEFALYAYCDVCLLARSFDAGTRLYERLSLRVQSDRKVVVLAVRCEGRAILDLLPSCLRHDHELFKVLILHDVLCLKYAPSLCCNPDLLKLCACLIQGPQKRAANTSDVIVERARRIKVGMSDALKFAFEIQSSQLYSVVSTYALWGLTCCTGL
jgi:hypothetical protein